MDVPNGAGGSTPQPPSPPHKALRALVVDGDTAHLQDLETLLRHCCYQVTACPHPVTALNLLRGSNGEFDVVLIDTSTQNLAWSEFLERVHCQMCMPIVLMSVAGLKDTIPAVVEEKASRHLTKPVSMEQLKCLRQLIVAGKPPPFNGESSSSCSSTGGGKITEKKEQGRKSEAEEKGEHGNDDHSGYPAVRKPRVVWTTELHNQFVDAVNKLGKGAVPKKILEEMDVPGLTRENIASHLQKYRLSLNRSESHQQRKNPQELSTAILRNLPPEVPLDPPNWALQHTCGVPGSSHLRRNNAAYDHNLGRLSAQRRFNIPLVQSYEQQILLRQQDQRMQSSAAAAAATAYLTSNINLPATSHMRIRNPNLKENMLMGGHTTVQYGAMQNLRSSWHVQASDFAKVSQELLGPEIYMKDELRESYTVHQIFPSIRTQDLHGSSVSSSDLPGSSVSSFNLPISSVTEDTYEEYIRNLPDLISDLESSGP